MVWDPPLLQRVLKLVVIQFAKLPIPFLLCHTHLISKI
jgi:hypothetical protein